MAINNQQIQDPSIQGTSGLRGLDGVNRLKERGINIDTSILNLSKDYRGTMNQINQSATPKQDIGFTGVGDSTFDEDITSASQLDNLANTRGELQPWYSQIGAGLAKGAILAGTTFLDGTVGLVLGGAQAIKEGRSSAIWDNPFSKAMQSVNEWTEEALPNYYTDAEKNEPWYDNIFTANFLGDKFIKNLGFTVGAFYSGNVAAKGLKISRLPELIGIISKSSQAPAIVTTGVGATISAVNEGRIEALNNSKDWFELNKTKLDDGHKARLQAIENYSGTSLYPKLLAQENENYESTLGKLTEDRLKMGNADLLMNIPILTASNIVQFGRMYANGFKTARKATNIVGKTGEYAASGSMKQGIARAALNPLSEGMEEMSQKVASVVSGKYYEDDVDNFYRSKIDPEAEEQTVSWMKSFASGINETVNDGSSWEEFFIGTLTGALGMPRFRGIRSNEGNLQSPITIEGGTLGEFREYKENLQRDESIAQYMNNRVNSPEFINYYQGLIRHNKYQNDMNNAVDNNDEFEFKNAEHAQLISDIAMFDNAGKLEDLTTLINSAYDTSDANLQSIVENTTSITTDTNGKQSQIGPFIDKNGNPMYSTQEGKQEMIDKLTKTKDEMLSTITNYSKIKDDIDVKTGQQLSDEQLEELTWLKSQIGNWTDRASVLASEIKPAIGNIIGTMSSVASVLNDMKTLEGQSNKNVTESYNTLAKNENVLKSNMEHFQLIKGLDDKALAYLFSQDPKIVESFKSIIEDSTFGLDPDEAQTISAKIDDMVKLVKASGKFKSTLKEYLQNPNKLQESIDKTVSTVAKNEYNKKTDNLKESLKAATTLSEFKDALDTDDDVVTKQEVLKSLEEEGNELAKNFREVNAYNSDIQRVINSMNEEPSVKLDALKLLQDQFENAENLQEIANPNSIFIDNESAIYDSNLSDEDNTKKFQEAQYVLLKAMNQINNENRFKDRFSKEYKTLKEKGTPNKSNPTKSTTGDSKTATVPTINGGLPVNTYTPPVGNITSTQVADENKNLNDITETTKSLDGKQKGRRPYYRPSIPELHIEGTKVGDFRPFNIVASEREKGVNFDEIYNYLKDNGAFTYVNEGNLKVGDDLGFMIDPEFNDHTIFIVDKRNNQIVGSLDESQYSVDKYEGLHGLEEKIKAEYNNSTDKTKRFIATPITKVSQIMVGKVPYGTEERSLSIIPNVTSEGKGAVFGIIKNGTLSTNGVVQDNLIIKPVDMSQKEGRMYLLIPNAAGKYTPTAVRVKHFNREEYDINNIEVQNTTMFKNIQEAIDALSNTQSEDELNEAVKLLKTNLYTGDLHIDWFTSNAGNGIRFTKVKRDANGNEIYEEKEGKRIRKEDTRTIFLTEKWDANTLFTITGNNEVQTAPTSKSIEEVKEEISNILLDFNLPIQVNLGMLNKGGYNNMLINSNILTSNITNASVISNWFTTDYFDINGNLQKATNPASVMPNNTRKIQTPVGGTEGVISGIKITIESQTVYVDLTNNTAKDDKGNTIFLTEKMQWEAFAISNYGDNSNGTLMVNNKLLLPDGRVFDRNTLAIYDSNSKESQEVKDRIAGRIKEKENTISNSNKVITQIYENQKNVDKTRTDGEFYYVLEEDGQYHEYSRVHTRLGSNWVESKKQSDALKDVRIKLSQLADNITQYNNYIRYLIKHYNIDLIDFIGNTDIKSRDTIVNLVKDKMSGTNSQRALDAGTAVDSVIRNFFTSNDTPIKPSNMSDKAFTDLITSLTEIRSNIEARGERFLANNIVLYNKYADGTRIAGEVDILSVDSNGNFKIYDAKTSRYSFYDFTDRYGNKVNYFKNKSTTQNMSTEEYYTLQLSAYKNLFESQYGTPITTLAILPFVLSYDKDTVSNIEKEKGILITYNPAVNVPLKGSVKKIESNINVPLFNSSLETMNPINNVLPEYTLNDSKVGYFVLDGKLHKGYLSPIGSINGVEVHITKIPTITKGFGRPGEVEHVASNSYIAVFPNGNTITLIKNDPKTLSEQQAKDTISKMLNGNPQRVLDMSKEKTLMFDPANLNIEQVNTIEVETPSNLLSNNEVQGAAKTIQAEQAINEADEEFEDEFTLRKVDSLDKPVWNQEKELGWINKVLPQLSENDRIKIIKGLIKVGQSGATAWGQFNNGIITLSDIAAEGTTYHEAFHVVFNLLLDNNEKQLLLEEARQKYGNKSDLELEEAMAEGFREYIMSRDTQGLGSKILNFFKELFAKVTNWKYMSPSLINYYRKINEGGYSNNSYKIQDLNTKVNNTIDNNTFNTLNNEIQNLLLNKGWTQEQFDSISQQERDQAVKCINL